MNWIEYPAGAHINFFDKGFYICVCRNIHTKKWEAHHPRSRWGGGIRIIAKGKTKKQCMLRAEKWFIDEVEKIYYASR